MPGIPRPPRTPVNCLEARVERAIDGLMVTQAGLDRPEAKAEIREAPAAFNAQTRKARRAPLFDELF